MGTLFCALTTKGDTCNKFGNDEGVLCISVSSGISLSGSPIPLCSSPLPPRTSLSSGTSLPSSTSTPPSSSLSSRQTLQGTSTSIRLRIWYGMTTDEKQQKLKHKTN